MSNSNAKFLTSAPMRHVAVMSATASIGLMAMFVVDFVDMIFISMLGNAALAAAIGYAGSILFFTTSFGIGIAIAAGALVARALGSGDEVLARSKASHALFYGVELGAIFAAVVWFNVLNLVTLVDASGETAELAASYLRIIIPSLPILVASIVASAVLRSHGAAPSSMYVTILGGVVNAILDPIFIFALDMNLAGAAWASVAARIASASLSFYFLFKNHGGLEAPDRVGLLRDFNPVMFIAIPAILTQFATPVGAAFATRAMAEFGEAAVAGMAVIGCLVPLAFGVVFALSGAVGPIIGQNYGAGQMDRVKRTFYDASLFTGVVVVVIALALFLLCDPIAALFALEQGPALALLYAFCGPLAILFYFNGAIFVSNAAFNNLGHPYYSTWINWGRHTIGTIPFLYLGGMWFGPVGVLAGPYVGGVIFGLVGLGLARRVMEQSQDSESEVQTHQAHQLRLFHLRR